VKKLHDLQVTIRCGGVHRVDCALHLHTIDLQPLEHLEVSQACYFIDRYGGEPRLQQILRHVKMIVAHGGDERI